MFYPADLIHEFDLGCRATLEAHVAKAAALHHDDPAAQPFTDTERDAILAALVCMFAHHSTDPEIQAVVAHEQEPDPQG